MNRHLEAFAGYMKHAISARSKYHIHSPFVYQFYHDVLRDDRAYSQYRVVNRLRKELNAGNRFIKRKDMGACCREMPGDQRFVRVKDILHHASVSRRKGQFLFRFIREYKPAAIIELGTSLGISSIYFGLAAPECKVVTIEGCIDSANLARQNIEKAGLHNISVLTGSFEEKLTQALVEIPSPDLVFFDGNHKKEPTLAYFEQCLLHAGPNSIFLFDDIHWSKGMGEAWNTIRRHPRVTVSIDLYYFGIVFFREELSREEFNIRF